MAELNKDNQKIDLPGYYDRFNPGLGWEALCFRATYVLQSAEMNEIQSVFSNRMKNIADAIFKDGDIIRDCGAVIGHDTGQINIESGSIYLYGGIRTMPTGSLKIDPGTSAIVAAKLVRKIVTEVEDPTLLDPAVEAPNNNMPGAARLVIDTSWVIASDDATDDLIFPVHYVDNGVLRAKEAPPVLDSTTQAIARYDVDNNKSNYISEGMEVTPIDIHSDSNQVFSVNAGRARVMGYPVAMSASRRLNFDVAPDLRSIFNEPHQSTTEDRQWVAMDRTPIKEVSTISITVTETELIVHNTVPGGSDPLGHTSVIEIKSITQSGVSYKNGTDFKLTAGQIDWSLPGNEPAPGSTYQVVYTRIKEVEPDGLTDKGFYVTGAVIGTLILTSYTAKLPRIDRIAIDSRGIFHLVIGVSTDYSPVRPDVPSTMLGICQVEQYWDSRTRIVNDGLKAVSMQQLSDQASYVMTLTDMVAQLAMVSDTTAQDGVAMKGLFVDPFLNDKQRDQGVSQSAAVAGQSLTLAVEGSPNYVSQDVENDTTCAFVDELILDQTYITGSMLINPYQAYAPFPAFMQLAPAVDNWVEYRTDWASPVTKRFVTTVYAPHGKNGYRHGETMPAGSQTYVEDVAQHTEEIPYLREIWVNFTINGFGAGEVLSSLTFDGIPVTPEAQ